MDESMINKIVPVVPFALEKKSFRENGNFLGESRDGKTYSINVLYENSFDPSDGTHRFALLPDNPQFLKIDKAVEDAGIELGDFPIEKLAESLKDMYGAWVIVDMSKTPVCRVYTENVSRMVDGKPQIVHKAGSPIHKKDPKTGEDLPELAIMTQVPVWGFCRKSPAGNWVWLKDNDPMVRIQREINQGRMIYVNLEKDFKIADGPDANTTTETKTEEAPAGGERPLPQAEAPSLGAVG